MGTVSADLESVPETEGLGVADSRLRLRPGPPEPEVSPLDPQGSEDRGLPPTSDVSSALACSLTNTRIVKAMRSGVFEDAVEAVYRQLSVHKGEAVRPAQRSIFLNAIGGVHEVYDADSAYRRSLPHRVPLQVVWLLMACGVCAVNLFELISPNIDQVRAFRAMMDAGQLRIYPVLALCMAVYEMAGVGFILFMIAKSAAMGPLAVGFDKWHELSNLAWCWLPTLARFSAIKMLGNVHPKTVLTDLQDLLERHHTEESEASCLAFCGSRAMLYSILLVIWKSLALLFGLAALLVKTLHLSEALGVKETTWKGLCAQGLSVTGYLNQCINITDVSSLLKKEAFRFAFAGEDAVYQRKELVFEAVFAACVAEGLWTTVGKQRGRLVAFAALHAFNHKDVQRLALGHTDKVFVRSRQVHPRDEPAPPHDGPPC